jgi:hypothetical protein
LIVDAAGSFVKTFDAQRRPPRPEPEPAGNSPFLAAVMVTLSGLAVALLPGEALIVASAKIL